MLEEFRDQIVEALIKNFEAQVEKHRLNIENLLLKGVGVAEHPDIMATIEGELAKMADNADKLEMLNKYFKEEQ
jgi:hypothetical protein